ncbi:MAG: hypothetical protein F9K32_00840 [Desulfobulbaceae bacterium]|nr:MAG: hypothetical protein F9K32_00840 [Desulfobulbaceae bacterium]
MRHRIEFDALRILDIGNSVSTVPLDHEQIGTPDDLGGSVVDFLVRQHAKLRSVTLDHLLAQHCLLFPYEDGKEARDRLETLLSDRCALRVQDVASCAEEWRIGDVLRLELVLRSPGLKTVDRSPKSLSEFAVTEMVRNAYRRLHAHEHPLAEWFFQVFIQSTQPTQIPLDVLHRHAVDNVRPTPAEAAKIMRENSAFWKSEIQSLGNRYLQATISDPKLMVLQNSALYQQLKRFFGEEE